MRKSTLGVILQKLSNCVCVFAELCKWQMRLCTSKPCNVHPTSVLLWKRGRRDRERRGKRRAEHTGEFSPGNLFILWAKPVVLFFNTQKKQEVSKLYSSLMTVTAPFSATFPIPVKKMKVSVSELSRKLINTVNMSGGWCAMHPFMYCMDGGGRGSLSWWKFVCEMMSLPPQPTKTGIQRTRHASEHTLTERTHTVLSAS